MDRENYTNRELEHYFKDMKGDLTEIKTQVQKTNGRVNRLEGWQSFMKGGLAVITVLIIPILLFIINGWITHK